MRERRQLVLVVDDEADQRETLRRGLRLLGFDCLTASAADAAAALLESEGGADVDLLLTDLTMPGGSGVALVDRVRVAHPALPVLAITGLGLSPEAIAIRTRRIPLLRKPFTVDQLGAAIDALLHL